MDRGDLEPDRRLHRDLAGLRPFLSHDRRARGCGVSGTDALPGVLAEVAEVAGNEAAVALSLGFGGDWLHVPRPDYLAAHPEHRLVTWLGAEAAALVARRMAGDSFYVPLARRACARHLAHQGLPVRVIAERLHTSARTIRRYLRGTA